LRAAVNKRLPQPRENDLYRSGQARLLAAALVWLLPLAALAQSLAPLPALNVDVRQTSVSGLSSGGFMAVQFAVAHSSIVKGVGAIAGGPYDCAQGDVLTATTRCSCTLDPAHAVCSVSATSTDVDALVRATHSLFSHHLIDDPANLAHQRVYVLAGDADPIVPKVVGAQLAEFYARFGASDMKSVVKPGLAHTMPTVAYGKSCDASATPYLGRCGFDGAGELLTWIYGPITKTPSAALHGRFRRFDQTRYVPTERLSWPGMDTVGWLYVPRECAAGERCALHVAFHGCEQGQSYIGYGTRFVRHAAYPEWADANHIVVLFPQAVLNPYVNPDGCWDWWGYTDENYATKRGVQIAAVRAMVDALAAGAAP
jgi:poly(3-hydroxybutyrate) depolymerase